jgi:hypothetical protein
MEADPGAIVGVLLLAISACLGLVCLFLVRILAHTKHGGHISTIRMWLHMSTCLEQIGFLIFHIKYHFLDTDFKIQESCIVLRFISALASTMTNSWIFVIASFYLMLTIKPAKCFTFHSRFLSHCFTWTWTCVSCLMYLMLSFLLKAEFHMPYIKSCWESNPRTIHMYLTYGNEFIPLFLSFVFISCARYRIPLKREVLQNFSHHSQYHMNVECITNSINRYVILSSFLLIYYIAITFRILLVINGSDLVLMVLQAGKGIIIGVMTCFFSNDVISLICRHKYTKQITRNGYRSGSMNVNGFNGTVGSHELDTLTFVSWWIKKNDSLNIDHKRQVKLFSRSIFLDFDFQLYMVKDNFILFNIIINYLM